MLSYRHAFHAGNHADILKHFALCAVLQKLTEKPKPFTVFDTHAGAGCYDTTDERTLKTGECANGIQRLLAFEDNKLPEVMQNYVKLCRSYQKRKFYPGSPEIERCFMKEDNALILCELHNTEIDILKANMAENVLFDALSKQETSIRQSVKPQIHHRSGYEALNALTPPKIKRGLAVIDPSYEEKSDFLDAAQAIAAVHKKWEPGIMMLWYPLLAHRKQDIANMKRILTAAAQSGANISETLDVQLLVNSPDSHVETSLEETDSATAPRLYGSGLFFINPPYMIENQFKEVLPFLAETFGVDGNGSFVIKRT